MAKAAGAFRVIPGIINQVKDDVVPRCTYSTGNEIKSQLVPDSPGDVVVRAGSITAHTQRPQQSPVRRVEGETAPKDVYATTR